MSSIPSIKKFFNCPELETGLTADSLKENNKFIMDNLDNLDIDYKDYGYIVNTIQVSDECYEYSLTFVVCRMNKHLINVESNTEDTDHWLRENGCSTVTEYQLHTFIPDVFLMKLYTKFKKQFKDDIGL